MSNWRYINGRIHSLIHCDGVLARLIALNAEQRQEAADPQTKSADLPNVGGSSVGCTLSAHHGRISED